MAASAAIRIVITGVRAVRGATIWHALNLILGTCRDTRTAGAVAETVALMIAHPTICVVALGVRAICAAAPVTKHLRIRTCRRAAALDARQV